MTSCQISEVGLSAIILHSKHATYSAFCEVDHLASALWDLFLDMLKYLVRGEHFGVGEYFQPDANAAGNEI
jgi:hypothetical protein